MSWSARQTLWSIYPDKPYLWSEGYLVGAMHEAYGPESLTPDMSNADFAAGFRQGMFDCSLHGMSGKGCARIGLPLSPPFTL